MPSKNTLPLEPGYYYHIYNRAVGSEKLFTCDKDYQAFLERVKLYLLPVVDVYCYCLLPNHFHFFIRFRVVESSTNLSGPKDLTGYVHNSKPFSDCFNSYTKWFNTKYDRKGGLFMTPFKRKLINDENQFTQLIYYIHRNPVHHHLVKDMAEWKYSSYNSLISNGATYLQRQKMLDWFYGRDKFISYHKTVQEDYNSGIEN